jgi:phage host-nuclease inhibitor protein Gam
MNNTREKVDAALARIAAHQREIDRIEAELNEGIDNQNAAAGQAAREHVIAVANVTASLKAKALENRAELFGGAKTLNLPHGELGFRSSTSLCLARKNKTWDDVLEDLIGQGQLDAVRVIREVNKDVLKAWPDKTLAAFDLRLKTTEKFFVKPDVEKLQRT